VWAEYYVNLRLCTDTNTRGTWQKGNLAEAVGQKNSLFLLTDAAKNPGHISNNNSFKKGTGLTSFDLEHGNSRPVYKGSEVLNYPGIFSPL